MALGLIYTKINYYFEVKFQYAYDLISTSIPQMIVLQKAIFKNSTK